MDGLEHKVRETVEQYHMLEPGGRVIAAVSGGADSVCLLMLLLRLGQDMGLSVRAVHVHHGLRGEEADRDAEFVRSLCAGLDVPCHIIRVDVREFAARCGLSEEEAGRSLRYEALEREAAGWEEIPGQKREAEGRGGEVPGSVGKIPGSGDETAGSGREIPGGRDEAADRGGEPPCSGEKAGKEPSRACHPIRIAVAHHRDDQAETILHNLFRGSGLAGLKGIAYTRGRIIRPLLEAGREEILGWLEERGIAYVKDSTNDTDHYTRNRIRNRLLPEIEESVNQGAVGNILRMGRLAAQADAYIGNQAEAWIGKYVQMREGEAFIPQEAFLGEPEILRSYIVFRLLERQAGRAKDLGLIHVQQVLELAGRPVGRRVNLPYGLTARKEYAGVSIGQEAALRETCDGALPAVAIETFPYKKGREIPKNMYTKWFDCDKIKDTPVVRTRCTGDYMILADGRHKALTRFMIDEKIPRQMRDEIPLLADGSHVMWVIGNRISEFYKIGPGTIRVLQASVRQPDMRKE